MIDMREQKMAEVEVKGKIALFTELRVDKDTVPEGMYCYALRHGDDDRMPCTIERKVGVNYFGAIIVSEPFEFENKDYIAVSYDDFWFTEEHLKISEYAEKIKQFQSKEVFEYNGFHYMPVRSFNQKEEDMSLLEISMYLRDSRGTEIGEVGYNHKEFYVASGNSSADIFLCVENGKQYIPCENSLQEYQSEKQVQKSKAR